MAMGTRSNKLPVQLSVSCLIAVLIMLAAFLLVPDGTASAATTMDSNSRWSQRLCFFDSFGSDSAAHDGAGAGPYVVVSDGRVLNYNGGWSTYAHVPGYNNLMNNNNAAAEELTVTKTRCGRPVSLRFHHESGDLYVADSCTGLLKVGKGGEVTVVATEADSVPINFTENELVVDQDSGDVFLTDYSNDSSPSTGRLIKYDPRANRATVLLQAGLNGYPNSLVMSSDRTHLVIALARSNKLLRYWIKKGTDDNKVVGMLEEFVDLPGYPADVRPDGTGGYSVALQYDMNMEELHYFGPNNFRIYGVRVGADGQVIQVIRNPKTVRPMYN